MLSCIALENALGDVLAASFESADRSCSVDADCVEAYWGVGCYTRCARSLLSEAGRDSALMLAEQAIAPVCTELETRPYGQRTLTFVPPS